MVAELGDDSWLARWLPLVAERAGGHSILELGCGSGRDSATLADAGHTVVGVDLSGDAIERACSRVPSARFYCQDIRAPFPAPPGVGVVVASLSLHYFPWEETVDLVERIRNHLRRGGVLLCRLNSTGDVHYGAVGHPWIAGDYYLVDGEPKRFFDRGGVDELFRRGWRITSLEEHVVNRYAHPKVLWEVILERDT